MSETKHPGPSGKSANPSDALTISRRRFLLLSGMATAGVALTAHGCGSSGSSENGGEAQLVYQDWNTEWFVAMAREMLEQFMEEHPNIRVFYTRDPSNFREECLADMQAGTAADVFQGCSTHFPVFAQAGYCLDLRPYVAADIDQETKEDWDQAQYNFFFTTEGLQYGLPKYNGALALYYNKDLFDEHGESYPDTTWDHDDYLAAMRALTHRNGDGSTEHWGSMIDIGWDRLQMHVNGWGGHFVDPNDSTRCLMGESKSLEAMEWIRARMWDDKVMATSLDVGNVSTRQAFIGQRLAMVEDGSWALKDILTGADFRVGVAPFPAGPEHRVTLATNDGFAIYANTKYPDAAWELMKFLISKDYGRAMARANFLQPARKSLVDEWVGFIREEFPEKSEDVDIAVFADGHVNGYSVTTEIFANMDAAKQLADAAWEEIFTSGDVGVERMEEVCQRIEEAQES
jgi:multiple sugar transport system substrate-binding protein